MKKVHRITAICSIILLLFLFATDPQELPSSLLIVPFALLFMIIAGSVLMVPGAQKLPRQKMIKLGVAAAAVPVLLLILQSLGQLTIRDALAVAVLFGVAYFYISRFGVRLTN